ncbi:MAG TPA: hypothetical protein VKV39_10580 [Candidatus Sulfotelmatobacter sp.]|nr:hypothetical protein [Candidatus Sulfotelmatobacter sp.]
MKKLAFLILLAIAVVVSSCGTRTTPPTTTTTASGSWEASLTGGLAQATQLDFVVQFNVTNTNNATTEPLTIQGFSFFNGNACFVSGQSISGSSALGTSNANQVTGTMTFTITSGVPGGNTLTMTSTDLSGTANNGNLSNGAVTGTWTLTGGQGDPSCCQGSSSCPAGQQAAGVFNLCQGAAPTCTVTN